MGRLWKVRHIPLAARRLVFRSRVQGAAVSGLEAFVLAGADYRAIDAVLVKCGRRLLGKLGCVRSEDDDGRQRYRGKSNQEI